MPCPHTLEQQAHKTLGGFVQSRNLTQPIADRQDSESSLRLARGERSAAARRLGGAGRLSGYTFSWRALAGASQVGRLLLERPLGAGELTG